LLLYIGDVRHEYLALYTHLEIVAASFVSCCCSCFCFCLVRVTFFLEHSSHSAHRVASALEPSPFSLYRVSAFNTAYEMSLARLQRPLTDVSTVCLPVGLRREEGLER
jgi:hypothetical protein